MTVFNILETFDVEKIRMKLFEFNIKVEKKYSVKKEALEEVLKLITTSQCISESTAKSSLKDLYNWPNEYLFPVLDIVRLAIRKENLCSQIATFELLDKITQNLDLANPLANKIMATRCLSNLVSHNWGRGLFEAKFTKLCNAVAQIKDGNAALQSAIATFYYNLSVSQVEVAVADKSMIIAECTVDFLSWADQPDAILRGYQALGNLTTIVYKKEILTLIRNHTLLIFKIKNHASGIEIDDYTLLQKTAQYLLDTVDNSKNL